MKLTLLSLVVLPLFARAADSVVVFNELQYHPANEKAQTEWIELRNLHGVDVDISGWRIEGGANFTFPEGTRIAGASLSRGGESAGADRGGDGAVYGYPR